MAVDLFADPSCVIVVSHRWSGAWIDVDLGSKDLSPVSCIIDIGKRREQGIFESISIWPENSGDFGEGDVVVIGEVKIGLSFGFGRGAVGDGAVGGRMRTVLS